MIINGKAESKSLLSWKIKIPIMTVYFVVIFLLNYFFQERIFIDSIAMEVSMQKIGNTGLIIMQYISKICGIVFLAPVFLYFYNFTNSYKGFFMFLVIISSNMITTILKLFFQNPRPYYYSYNAIKSYGCDPGFGNPSGHSLASSLIYFSMWHLIFVQNSRNPKNQFSFPVKVFSFIIFVLYVWLIMISRMFCGAHSLNQIIFGFLIGTGCYLTLFWVIEIDTNNYDQYLKLIKTNILLYIFPNVLIFATFIIYQFSNPTGDLDAQHEWENIILYKNCPYFANNNFLYEGLVYYFVFFGNIFAFLGAKLEYIVFFKEKRIDWIKNNFSEYNEEISNTSSFDIVKVSLWNDTSGLKSVFRIIVLAIICGVIVLPTILISFNANIVIIYLCKFFIPVSVACFFLFFVLKFLFRKLKISNFNLDGLTTSDID